MLKISEFQLKDVVNVADGKKLGNVGDIDIDLTTGKIQAVIIGGSRVLGFFGKDDEIVIPWKNIVKIGYKNYEDEVFMVLSSFVMDNTADKS